MLYVVFRGLARVALRLYYRDVAVVARERIPRDGPLLIAVNHPNALVDALTAVAVVPRRVTLTAKATLWENPLLALLLPRVGIVPLRRAADERRRRGARGERNAAAFAALLAALERRGAVLIFPEGKSHSEPQLAPLRTGLARIALQARDERGVTGLHVLPVGLVFERKWAPRSRVLVQVGEPLALDGWRPPAGGASPVEALTAAVDARLRAVTLNFDSAQEEAQTLGVATALAAAFDGGRSVGEAGPTLEGAVGIAQRVRAVRQRLAAAGPLPERAEQFLERLAALRTLARRHRVRLDDAEIATGLLPGALFTAREGALALLALPVAAWSAVHHYLPFRLAWWLGRRTSRNLDEPAMHTMVAGLALVLLFYALQAGLVGWLAGPWWALAYLVTLPVAAVVEVRTRDRLRRARERARAYTLFRRDPALRQRFAGELGWLRGEAEALEGEGDGGLRAAGTAPPDPSARPAGAGRCAGP